MFCCCEYFRVTSARISWIIAVIASENFPVLIASFCLGHSSAAIGSHSSIVFRDVELCLGHCYDTGTVRGQLSS